MLRLAVEDLLATRARAFVLSLGIALGVGVLMIVVGLGLGARDVVLDEVVQKLPVDVVEVVPKRMRLGPLEVGTGGILGGLALDEESVDRLAELEGVGAAFPKLEVKLPLGARGGARLFGRNLYTDLFATGLPEELVQPQVGPAFDGDAELIPVVISPQLIEIYNGSVASALGTPRLTGEALEGFEFEIVIGRSMMLGRRGARHVGVERARIVGVSPYAVRLGVSMPLETAKRLMDAYGEIGEHNLEYASVLLRAKSPADVPRITRAVRRAGLAVDDTAQRTSDILTAATTLASLVGVLVLILAGLNIAHSFFAMLAERRRELAILRAVGARKIDLVSLVLTEAVLLGVLGGIIGLAFAHASTWLIDAGARLALPDFPFKPESFFLLPWWLSSAALAAAVIASVLGALWPALRAAHAPLARALSEL